MVGDIISERWAELSRNGGRLHSGIVGGFERNPHHDRERGDPDTPEAGTWVSLAPGWIVTTSNDLSRIEIIYDGNQVVLQ
jgi:hypothetical protein